MPITAASASVTATIAAPALLPGRTTDIKIATTMMYNARSHPDTRPTGRHLPSSRGVLLRDRRVGGRRADRAGRPAQLAAALGGPGADTGRGRGGLAVVEDLGQRGERVDAVHGHPEGDQRPERRGH